jgi:hypothetical protein
MTRPSGNRSGKNVSKRLQVPVSDDEERAYKFAATLKHQPFAEWARAAMNAQAAKQGIEAPEKLDGE